MKRLLIGLLLVVPVGLVAINRCKVKKITQADVGDTGFVTSGSGRYVLCEDIRFAIDGKAAITIADDNVQLSLLNHSITLESVDATGIRIQKGDGSETITEILIDNDAIENTSEPTTSQSGIGIEVNKAQKVALLHICTMQNNIGLLIKDSCDVYVQKSSFLEAKEKKNNSNNGFGVQVTDSSLVTFEDCFFKDSRTNMVIDGESKDGKILTCTFENSNDLPNLLDEVFTQNLQVDQIDGLLIKNSSFSQESDLSGTFFVRLRNVSLGTDSTDTQNIRIACSTFASDVKDLQAGDNDSDILAYVRGKGLKIDSCLFQSTGAGVRGQGILLSGGGTMSVHVRGCTITGDLLTGILSTFSSKVVIEDSLIEKCVTGVALTSHSTVRSCTICDNSTGIGIFGESNVVSDSLICRNGSSISISQASSLNVIKNSRLTDNTAKGVAVTGDSNTIVNNEIHGNGTIGVDLLAGADNNAVHGNRIHNNGTAGVDDKGTANQIYFNTAFKNGVAVVIPFDNFLATAPAVLPVEQAAGASPLEGTNLSAL